MQSIKNIEIKQEDSIEKELAGDCDRKQKYVLFDQPVDEKDQVSNLKDRLLDRNDEKHLDPVNIDHHSEEESDEEDDMHRKPSLGNTTVRQSIKNMWTLMFHPKIQIVIPHLMQAGLWIGFTTCVLYRLVVQVLPPGDEAQIKQMISLGMILYSVASLAFTQYSKKISFQVSKQFMRWANIIATISFIFAFIFNKSANSLTLVMILMPFAGILDSCFNLLVSVYMSENFPGRIEGFSIYKQVQNLFGSLFIILYIAMKVFSI